MSESGGTVLIVDDDEAVLLSLRSLIERSGYSAICASDPNQAMQMVEAATPDVVIQDMNFGSRTDGEQGLALIDNIKARSPSLPVMLMTAWGSIDLAVAGMQRGAADFLTKPWENATLLKALETTIQLARGHEPDADRAAVDARGQFDKVIGESPAICKVLATVARVAPTNASVLITGESGTGKEVIADALHANSPRRDKSLVKVNLGGVPQSLFEAELFGHVRGAFTDARRDRDGHFAAADGGTLFLDEVGELEKASQVKLLRVLQDQRFQRLGESNTRQVDVRIISATNADLTALVEDGAFREDLYYRLHVVSLRLPPLRERREDIALLAHRFARESATRYGREVPSLPGPTLKWLEQQDWPGNVRELRQSLERAVLLSESDRLAPEDFEADGSEEMHRATSGTIGNQTLAEVEERLVREQLERHGDNLSQAAKSLGISRAALYRRMEKYGLRR